MTLGQYLNALRKRWLLIAAIAMLAGAGAYGYAKSTPPTYSATSKIFVSVSGGETANDLVQGTTYIKNLVDSYAALAGLPVVLDPVSRELDLSGAAPLAGRITADAPLNTSIIEITVRDGTPDRAAATSNAVAEQLALTVAELSPTASATDQTIKVSVVARATPPGGPVSPKVRLITLFGLAAGLGLGVTLAMARHLLDTRVKGAEDLVVHGDTVGLLGTVPLNSRVVLQPVTLTRPRSIEAEAYRRLQTNLTFIDVSTPARMIVVTSSISGEGKTTVSTNLAVALAESGRSVLLIDADLRRPTVHHVLGLEGAKGLTTVLLGDCELEDVVQTVAPRLDVLTSGATPPNPHQLIGADPMRKLLEKVRVLYDTVIIDSPPLLPVSDATILARLADGAVLVVGARRVRRQEVAMSLDTITNVGAPCLGVVVNLVQHAGPNHYYYSPDHAPEPYGWRDRLRAWLRKVSTSRGSRSRSEAGQSLQ